MKSMDSMWGRRCRKQTKSSTLAAAVSTAPHALGCVLDLRTCSMHLLPLRLLATGHRRCCIASADYRTVRPGSPGLSHSRRSRATHTSTRRKLHILRLSHSSKCDAVCFAGNWVLLSNHHRRGLVPQIRRLVQKTIWAGTSTGSRLWHFEYRRRSSLSRVAIRSLAVPVGPLPVSLRLQHQNSQELQGLEPSPPACTPNAARVWGRANTFATNRPTAVHTRNFLKRIFSLPLLV